HARLLQGRDPPDKIEHGAQELSKMDLPYKDIGNGECRRIALLSQEGSTIETAVEIVRGVVPEPHSLRMQSETFRLWNHPSRHRKERDDAALLTQEGNLESAP